VTYCTADDLKKRVSVLGVQLRTDNDEGGDTVQSIEFGSADLDFYLLPRYTAAQIVANGWAKTAAIILSVYHLCWLRLNDVPETVQRLRDEWLAKLEIIRTGAGELPGTAVGPAAGPEVVNMSVRLDAYPQIQVDPARSVRSDRTYPERRNNEWVYPPRVG
jgi:hypothetical protein